MTTAPPRLPDWIRLALTTAAVLVTVALAFSAVKSETQLNAAAIRVQSERIDRIDAALTARLERIETDLRCTRDQTHAIREDLREIQTTLKTRTRERPNP
jgi:cytochrome c-type biogenesis protein CcmH/NrfF